jgi:uncharacterized membrane protein
MFRKAVADTFEFNKEFRLRGHEVRRIEAFSDAVFAFAVTLLIVSLEVPKNFEELIVTMRGFFAFGVCFVLLMSIWYEQNIFFRRYGLDDIWTIVLNCALIFLVLFYVYPLKFLFTLLFSKQIYGNAHSPLVILPTNVPTLMEIYGVGFISIYFLFCIMYLHVRRKKVGLQLTEGELFETNSKIYKTLIFICTGIISVVIALLLKPDMAGLSGFTYFLIAPALSIFYRFRSKRKKKLYPA